jgi:mono/diheme cytochrome c family protein
MASGPMADAITHSLSHLTEADLRAIAVYLKSLPPGGGTLPQPISTNPKLTEGAAIYFNQCAACHGAQGQGIVGLFPRLAGDPVAQQQQATSLIRVVLEGARAVATPGAPTGPAMPSFAWRLSDDDVAAVLTYIRNAWGNAAPGVESGDVGSMRALLHRQAQQSP